MSEQETFASTPLDSLFSGDESEIIKAAAEAEVKDTGETESSPGSGEEATGESTEESTAKKEAETSDEESDESKTVPLAALKAEREKYRKRIAELESQAPQEEKPKPPSVFEDEEGFNQNLDQRVKTAELRATLRLSKVMLAKEIGEDGVQDVWDRFSEAMKENPRLEREFAASDHPFEYAQKQVEKYDLMQKIETGEIDKELESRVEKMLEEKLAAMSGEDGGVPRSLASRSSQGVSSNSYAGPAKLENILALPD
jgi:hypothetical protein